MQGRAISYARYSDEKQNAASIEDQHEICRRYIDQHGWTLGACYEDAAISGASVHLRPGVQRLITDAQAGRLDVSVLWISRRKIENRRTQTGTTKGAHTRHSYLAELVSPPARRLRTGREVAVEGMCPRRAPSQFLSKGDNGNSRRSL